MGKNTVGLIAIIALVIFGFKYNGHIQEQKRVEAAKIEEARIEAARVKAARIETARLEAEAELKRIRINAAYEEERERNQQKAADERAIIASTIWGQVYDKAPPYTKDLRKMKVHKRDK